MWSLKYNRVSVFVCCSTYPVQSLNLQILEKWSQKFDGVVGQDDGQNSKPLVSEEKQKENDKKMYAHDRCNKIK